MFHDDAAWTITATAGSAAFAPDVQIVAPDFFEFPGPFVGVEGLRAGWLQWLSPWEGYRTEVEDVIDRGDSIVLLIRDYGRRTNDANEVANLSAAVWTVRDRTITRVEFYTDRHAALKALGRDE